MCALCGLGAAAAEAALVPLPALAVDSHRSHTCAIVEGGQVRCWGIAAFGRLGVPAVEGNPVGDNETPGSIPPVDIGAGRTATAITVGGAHSCALLDGGDVRCWGRGNMLGYGSVADIGTDDTPGSHPVVPIGGQATAIDAGDSHTCVILVGGAVRCWGGNGGQLGTNNTTTYGDDEPASDAPLVDLGGRTALAISAGDAHTCAILDDHSVRCWGANGQGQLGRGDTTTVGDNESPNTGSVNLGPGRTAIAIAAGSDDSHTCAVLDNGDVRCWGRGIAGQLGYGDTAAVGKTPSTTPDQFGPVNIGAGRTATAITTGNNRTCVILDTGAVRCWGSGTFGGLGYGNTDTVGTTPGTTPETAGPVDIGAGRTASAITLGMDGACVLMDDSRVRCWGGGFSGQLGYGNTQAIGDDELPSAAGPVDLGSSGSVDAPPPSGGNPPAPVVTPPVIAPPLDRTPPQATLVTPKAKLANVVSKGLVVTLTCTEACSGTARITLDKATARRLGLGNKIVEVARRAIKLRAGAKTKITLLLSAKAKAKLRQARAVTLHLEIAVIDAAKNRRVVKRPVSLHA
jgi:alpha-tubulin suppressor-like RCC1 family protein